MSTCEHCDRPRTESEVRDELSIDGFPVCSDCWVYNPDVLAREYNPDVLA